MRGARGDKTIPSPCDQAAITQSLHRVPDDIPKRLHNRHIVYCTIFPDSHDPAVVASCITYPAPRQLSNALTIASMPIGGSFVVYRCGALGVVKKKRKAHKGLESEGLSNERKIISEGVMKICA